MKRKGVLIFSFVLVFLILSLSLVSAGWFSNFWGKVTGQISAEDDSFLGQEDISFCDDLGNCILYEGHILTSLEDVLGIGFIGASSAKFNVNGGNTPFLSEGQSYLTNTENLLTVQDIFASDQAGKISYVSFSYVLFNSESILKKSSEDGLKEEASVGEKEDAQDEGCSDSDGGINYDLYGVRTLNSVENIETCTNEGGSVDAYSEDYVYELYCVGEEIHFCEGGCVDGACVPGGTDSIGEKKGLFEYFRSRERFFLGEGEDKGETNQERGNDFNTEVSQEDDQESVVFRERVRSFFSGIFGKNNEEPTDEGQVNCRDLKGQRVPGYTNLCYSGLISPGGSGDCETVSCASHILKEW